MNRKTKLSLVSSTPHIKKQVTLGSVFENGISPITLNVEEGREPAKRLKTTTNKHLKHVEENEAKSRRKRSLPVRGKVVPGSVRSAGLKERLNAKASSTNILYNTRQSSNGCYPQLVILDSDEEADFQSSTAKLLPEKKSILKQPTISLARAKDVDRRKRIKKNLEDNNHLKESKGNAKEKPTTSNQETPQPSCSRQRIAKKQPLSNLANISSNEKINEGEIKQAAIKKSKNPALTKLDTEESIFCDSILPVNITSFKNKRCLEFSTLEDIVGKDAIKWTPRSKATKFRAVNKEVIRRKLDSNENSDSDNLNNVSEQFTNTTVNGSHKENIDKKITKNVPVKNESVKQENNLPKELFSCFADVVFKPSNKHKGCVIASSLVTGSSDFGYLELDGDSSFTGKLPNVTYVLLEGSVKALLQGKSQNLAPGDILHINDDSGYHLKNVQPVHARFLYVKQHHST